MSREKLLWGICIGLAALAATLAVLLAQSMQPVHSEGLPPAVEEHGRGNGSNGENGQEQPGDSPSIASGSEPNQRVVARAGNVSLLEDEFLAGLQKEFGDEYVRKWLSRTVVQLEAQALGISISRAEIDEELRRMRVGYESEAAFYRVMREQLGLSEEDLRRDALHRLMLEAVATSNVTVTEADVEAYIEENPEQFMPIHDIRYAQIITDSIEQMDKVIAQLKEGVDFTILAMDVSIDSDTAVNGGDSGWISAEDPFLPSAIVDALSAMNVGDISPPLKLGDNIYAVITLLGRRTIHPLHDSSVREELRRELALARAPSLFDVESALLKKYNAVDFLNMD